MPKSKSSPDEILSAEQAATIAGVHKTTIIDWIKRGILPAGRLGFGLTSPYRIRRSILEKILAKRGQDDAFDE